MFFRFSQGDRLKDMLANNKIGILLSGRGSNFIAIHRAILDKRLPAEISCVISNRRDAPGLEASRQAGLNSFFIDHQSLSREEFDRRLIGILTDFHADIVCLAGFMRLLSPLLIDAFPRKILNIHPSLLPAFPGLHAQRQALEAGVRYSGCTVHFVDCGLDSGPIILQSVVPVLDEDTEETLSARILEQEHKIYPQAIGLVLEGKHRLVGRRFLVAQRPKDPLCQP
jgi:phosphoribosylglycinamide formyltransferase 1